MLKDVQTMPTQTQTSTLDTLLQILVGVICSSAHKPFSTQSLEILFRMIRDGKQASFTCVRSKNIQQVPTHTDNHPKNASRLLPRLAGPKDGGPRARFLLLLIAL